MTLQSFLELRKLCLGDSLKNRGSKFALFLSDIVTTSSRRGFERNHGYVDEGPARLNPFGSFRDGLSDL